MRQLAHALQGSLTTLAGKRIAPHLPKLIGAWLSGAYDSDRLVSRTAQDSIASAFNSDDKRRALWKIYKNALVEYASDAILVQTSRTLSDERSTTPDDAEAKFVRVVGNAIQLLSQVIKVNYRTAHNEEQVEIAGNIKTIVGEKKLWEYSSHEDAALRRAICNLVTVCVEVMTENMDWTTISACFIGKALHSNQLGSSRQFSEALLALTSARPTIWTMDYSSKTAPSKRLNQYLRQGSQRGPVEYWSGIQRLLKAIPFATWNTSSDDGKVGSEGAATILESLRAGINSNEEPRQNLEAAWSAYLNISFWALGLLVDDQSKASLLKDHVLPLTSQYIASDEKVVGWNTPIAFGPSIAARILTNILLRESYDLFESTWVASCHTLCENMKLSLPESSKEFTGSQDGVIAQARRFFRLKTLLMETEQLSATMKAKAVDVFRRSDEILVQTSIQLLNGRNGKPYCAAAVLDIIATPEQPAPQELTIFLESDALDLLDSPSAEYLASMFLRSQKDLAQVFLKMTASPERTGTLKALANLLGGISEHQMAQNSEVDTFILHHISHLEAASSQELLRKVLANENLTESALRRNCLEQLLAQLSPDTELRPQRATLRFFSSLISDRSQNSSLLADDVGRLLLNRLLILADSDDPETAELAKSLLARVKTTPLARDSTTASSAAIIADQLSGRGDPLSIFVLVDLAKDTLQVSEPQQAELTKLLLPSAENWQCALEEHFGRRPPLSLSITSPLRGLIFMVSPDQAVATTSDEDADGFSWLFRLVMYTTRIILDAELFDKLSEEQLQTLYSHYPVVLQIINEKLTIESANGLWHITTDEVAEDAAEILSQGSTLVQRWTGHEKALDRWMEVIRSTGTLDTRAYYYCLAFADVASRFVDEQGSAPITKAFDPEIKDMHRSEQVARSAGLIAVCRDHLTSSPPGWRLLNELVAAVSGLKLPFLSEQALRPLVLLDILLGGSSEPLEQIPVQRQDFLMQSLLRMISDVSIDSGVRALTFRLLEPVVATISSLYGEHWEQILQSLVVVFQSGNNLDEDIPLLHASLRLYGRLRSLSESSDANEDLIDAWKTMKESLEEGLLNCLAVFEHLDTAISQPRRITAALLRRQLLQITARHDASLYPFLSSNEDAVRGASYDQLHRSIPMEQEQISLGIALEHKIAHLPPDLLTLLSDVPDASRSSTTSARHSYLLCWNLVFDHFPNASYKLREFYMADIKEAGALGSLLDLVCEVCRITSGRAVDASKTDVQAFELGSSETEEQEEQRLSMHLYYCSLLYLPGLTRSWFIEQKNRVKSPLESWTQRYFAPALVSAASVTVTEWVKNQPQEDGESTLSVKSSFGGSETVASIQVDPDSPPISLAISLPKTFPLDSPTVSSRTRVGVSEKNWQSWLRTIQIIIFSTGSIIEGLIAFRRNVQGALKGQSECAICYSIIGTDMQTPNKRCGTCRNTFHGACLFRWFRSSNSSSCPLCRNNFNYA